MTYDPTLYARDEEEEFGDNNRESMNSIDEVLPPLHAFLVNLPPTSIHSFIEQRTRSTYTCEYNYSNT